jgi:hypothetical protein
MTGSFVYLQPISDSLHLVHERASSRYRCQHMDLMQLQARVLSLETTLSGLLIALLSSNFKSNILIGYQIGIPTSPDRTLRMGSRGQRLAWRAGGIGPEDRSHRSKNSGAQHIYSTSSSQSHLPRRIVQPAPSVTSRTGS